MQMVSCLDCISTAKCRQLQGLALGKGDGMDLYPCDEVFRMMLAGQHLAHMTFGSIRFLSMDAEI